MVWTTMLKLKPTPLPKPTWKKMYPKATDYRQLTQKQMTKALFKMMRYWQSLKGMDNFRHGNKYRQAIAEMEANEKRVYDMDLNNISEDETLVKNREMAYDIYHKRKRAQNRKTYLRQKRKETELRIAEEIKEELLRIKEGKSRKRIEEPADLPPGTTVTQQKKLGITPINPSKRLKEQKEAERLELERVKAWHKENINEGEE